MYCCWSCFKHCAWKDYSIISPQMNILLVKIKCLEWERWLTTWENLLLFEKTGDQFLACTWWLSNHLKLPVSVSWYWPSDVYWCWCLWLKSNFQLGLLDHWVLPALGRRRQEYLEFKLGQLCWLVLFQGIINWENASITSSCIFLMIGGGGPSHCGWCHSWADSPGFYGCASYEEQVSKQHPLMASV